MEESKSKNKVFRVGDARELQGHSGNNFFQPGGFLGRVVAMERDFMGIGGKDSVGLKEDSRGSRQDSVYVGGSAVQWPFSNKMAALQHLMSFKTVPDEKAKKAAFDHLSSSGFQPVSAKNSFEPSYRASSAKETPQVQRCFSLDRHGAHQFSRHAYQPHSTESFGASNHHVISHPSIPVSMSSLFFKVHGSSNSHNLPVTSLKQQPHGGFAANSSTVVGTGDGTFVPRNVSKPTTTSQLTIFYEGSVNVYDDVPLDKAQAIMLMASKACNASSNASNQRPENPVSSPIPKVAPVNALNPNHTLVQNQAQNPTISVTSRVGSQPRSSSSTVDDVAGAKNVVPVLPVVSQHESSKAMNTSAPVLPRAVPQARKASLARFLEKRKERVTNAMPYPCAKNSPENSSGFEGANVSSKCPSPDLSLPSNREESWCSVQPKNSLDIGDSPSTKLKM